MVKKSICCGCGACEQVCPKGCISMIADAEGFLYPEIDKTKCVQCGLCDQACPVTQKKSPGQIRNAYVARAEADAIREESSSGGAFSLMADWILIQQGVVFGVAFDEDLSACHVKAETKEELRRIRGSKYLQSNTKNTYKEAKQALKDGRPVLFSGTSCQIAGLRSYLSRDYENLYTVDVLCHGVPSPEAWQNYLKEQKKQLGGEISDVFFRDKHTGWKNYSVRINAQDGGQYRQPFRQDPYMRCFINNLSLRPSCHNCKFKGCACVSDVMIADAWGVERWIPEADDDKGTSMALIHTEKGQKMWDAICESMLTQSIDPEKFLVGNSIYWKPADKHPNRKKFFKKLKQNAEWSELEQLCRRSPIQKITAKGLRGVRKLLKRIKK